MVGGDFNETCSAAEDCPELTITVSIKLIYNFAHSAPETKLTNSSFVKDLFNQSMQRREVDRAALRLEKLLSH